MRFDSFADFYPYYLSEHQDRTCRRLHVVGTALVCACIVAAMATNDPSWLVPAPLFGYGFAWVGHYFFEHNRPATFKHPLYSLLGDWVMFRDVLVGRIPF